ncbi:DUF4446 family protein [Patescibacteria group bacterium]|nr:DUF4446 family protein [Patescibacteria group bacterium]MBU1256451.1 DUF4446 family protein [Patescibacteria group bacterium]MBU1457396.1 DUF4446 family protein [Patescibacteria group bacterium]
MDFILISLIGLVVWLALITFFYIRLSFHYRHLTQGVTKKNLLSSLNHLIAQSKINKEELDMLTQKVDSEIKQNKLHLQKIGFKRFNPFTNTGGNQSFTLCLLDENNTGIVISSLHSRESTRLYAKEITKSKSETVSLSSEEQEIVKEATKK